MNIYQDRPASSGQWLRRHDLLNFITTLYEGDLHAKRVLSLANATVGVLMSASLAIHAVGRGLAQAMGTLTKHGVKQVDRLLSNRGVDVWAFFAYWTPFIVGARTEVVVALDWTSFAADGQDTIVLSMVTGHGRATPLLWKTVASSTLKGNQRRYEYEVLCRLRAHASPYFCRYQITPKTSRYTRCSMSMLPNVSINRRIRSSGQLGRWWYSISPCRNNECVRCSPLASAGGDAGGWMMGAV